MMVSLITANKLNCNSTTYVDTHVCHYQLVHETICQPLLIAALGILMDLVTKPHLV